MVKSPCVAKCELRNGKCVGCGRTIDEISNWKSFTEEEKLSVMDRLKFRICWPDIHFPPINLLVLHSAKWNDFK